MATVKEYSNNQKAFGGLFSDEGVDLEKSKLQAMSDFEMIANFPEYGMVCAGIFLLIANHTMRVFKMGFPRKQYEITGLVSNVWLSNKGDDRFMLENYSKMENLNKEDFKDVHVEFYRNVSGQLLQKELYLQRAGLAK